MMFNFFLCTWLNVSFTDLMCIIKKSGYQGVCVWLFAAIKDREWCICTVCIEKGNFEFCVAISTHALYVFFMRYGYRPFLQGIIMGCMFAAAFSCGPTDPLQTEDIVSAQDIRPVITVGKTYCTATIYDSRDNPVRINDGGVYVNGIILNAPPVKYGGSGIYNYQSDSIRLVNAEVCTVTVVLSNGSRIESYVTIPDSDLTGIVLPDTLGTADDLVISWSNPDPIVDMELSLDIDTGDSTWQLAYTVKRNASEYYVRSDLLAGIPSGTHGTVYVWIERPGEINSRFMDGGSITYYQGVGGSFVWGW